MGTNYYMKTGKKKKEVCNLGHTHLVPEQYHIGKSSFGRYFVLHEETLPDGTVLNSLESWKRFFEKYDKASIIDEYGEVVEPDEMWKTITRENREPAPASKKEWKKSLVGKPCDSSYHGLYYDKWGERGFVKTHGLKTGEDGLYQLMNGDFS